MFSLSIHTLTKMYRVVCGWRKERKTWVKLHVPAMQWNFTTFLQFLLNCQTKKKSFFDHNYHSRLTLSRAVKAWPYYPIHSHIFCLSPLSIQQYKRLLTKLPGKPAINVVGLPKYEIGKKWPLLKIWPMWRTRLNYDVNVRLETQNIMMQYWYDLDFYCGFSN